MSNDFDFNFDDILSEFDADASNSVRSDEYEEDEYESVEIPSPRTGARVSGGHLCEAEALTESSDETVAAQSADERGPRYDAEIQPDDDEEYEEDYEDEEPVPVKQKAPKKAPKKAKKAKKAKKSAEEYEEEARMKELIRAERKNNHESTGGIVGAIVALVLILGLAGGAVFAAIHISNSDKILPHVTAGEVDLGGMTVAEAESALTSAGWDQRAETPLTVKTIGDITFTVDPVESGAIAAKSDVVDAAYKYGHDSNIFKNLLTYIKNIATPVDVNSDDSDINSEYLDGVISTAEADIDEYMGTETYTLDEENSCITLKKGVGEIYLDTAGLKSAIVQAIRNGETELEFTDLSAQPTMPDFNAIHTELKRDPVDAYFSDDGRFEVTDEIVGCDFDVATAQSLWNEAAAGAVVTVPVTITVPEVTGDSLRGTLFCDLLGTMTTDYSASVDNRKSNVRLATSKIDGLILYPGDEFSYNTTVGARTVEAGFLSAPAYSNGEVVEEIGGGACQVSSTLYSACLFAFMEITDRTNHYFAVNYMQLGTDATVTIPSEGNAVDFCFRNNRDYPIKIVGYTNEEEDGTCTITFEIWGTRQEGDYAFVEFNNSNQYGWDNQWSRTVEVDDPGDFQLAKVKLVTDLYSAYDDALGRDCRRTLTYRIVTDLDGNELLNECINPLLADGNPAMDTYYYHTS